MSRELSSPLRCDTEGLSVSVAQRVPGSLVGAKQEANFVLIRLQLRHQIRRGSVHLAEDILESSTINAVRVHGMHGQFNVDVSLRPGLNVLYGLNGRGKTTLLHLIANVLELDFDRFRYLQFQSIELDISNGSRLQIVPPETPDSRVSVLLDGNLLDWVDEGSDRANSDRAMLRSVLGNRPNYLPAFRSILERVRNESFVASQTSAQQQEIDRLRMTETRLQKQLEAGQRGVPRYLGRTDPAVLTAHKTVQCRQWFGAFVPVIRYPSIVEVTDRLESEFRDAELEVASLERRMFSDFFLGTIQALLSTQDPPSEQEFEGLLTRIRAAVVLEEKGYLEYHGDKVIQQLAQVVDSVKSQGATAGAAEKRVLRLYATMLERRNQERLNSFDRIRKFESAVNKFLDNKTLHIAESRLTSERSHSRGIYVESENRHQYALTSLSSGERQVLTMLFSASRMSATSGAFLIDEPELSLHIDWQRIVLGELMTQAGDRQIIACTHSPEVGADHADAVQIFNPLTYDPLGPEHGVTPDSILDESV